MITHTQCYYCTEENTYFMITHTQCYDCTEENTYLLLEQNILL